MMSQINVVNIYFFKRRFNTGVLSTTMCPRNNPLFRSLFHTHRMHVSFSTAWLDLHVLPVLLHLVWSPQSNTCFSSLRFPISAYPVVNSSILHSIWMIYLVLMLSESLVLITKNYNQTDCFNFNICLGQETRRYKILKWRVASVLKWRGASILAS